MDWHCNRQHYLLLIVHSQPQSPSAIFGSWQSPATMLQSLHQSAIISIILLALGTLQLWWPPMPLQALNNHWQSPAMMPWSMLTNPSILNDHRSQLTILAALNAASFCQQWLTTVAIPQQQPVLAINDQQQWQPVLVTNDWWQWQWPASFGYQWSKTVVMPGQQPVLATNNQWQWWCQDNNQFWPSMIDDSGKAMTTASFGHQQMLTVSVPQQQSVLALNNWQQWWCHHHSWITAGNSMIILVLNDQ